MFSGVHPARLKFELIAILNAIAFGRSRRLSIFEPLPFFNEQYKIGLHSHQQPRCARAINVGIDQCLHFGALQANVTISINFGDTGSKNGSILASIRQKYFRLSVRCSELFVQPVS